MAVQAPPNLSDERFPELLDAGIDDWGGVSPVTPDHVNPEAPWPALDALRAATEARGLRLAPRLPIYPDHLSERWLAPPVHSRALALSDATGLGRGDAWHAGEATEPPAEFAAWSEGAGRPAARGGRPARRRRARRRRRRRGADRGPAHRPVRGPRPGLPRRVRGGRRPAPPHRRRGRDLRRQPEHQLHERLLLPLHVLRLLQGPARRRPARQAVPRAAEGDRSPLARGVDRGATEVCLQGGIHPSFTGDFYVSVVEAVKDAVPDMHVHAFTPLEVWQGAATLGCRSRTTCSG